MRPGRVGTVVSFDIDGTLEIGAPPGIISVGAVRIAQTLGYVVGTCSDRPVAHQRDLWTRLGLVPDFTVLKHRLGEVKAGFAAAAYYHIGDTDLDARVAGLAGFRFLRADAVSVRAWGPQLFPEGGLP
ncbi:MAG TPA: hypothetical protein VFV05_26450 [Methylomirabilota bacterium]|nr:hypothetical protein [Methylomirabilota bacterium]